MTATAFADDARAHYRAGTAAYALGHYSEAADERGAALHRRARSPAAPCAAAASVVVASGAVQVVAGGSGNYAVIVDRADRYLVDWGADGWGQLGDGRMSSVPSPAPVQPKW